MKKIIILISFLSLLFSCNEQKKEKQEIKKQETKEIVEKKIEPKNEIENKPKTKKKSSEKSYDLNEKEFLSVFLLENRLNEKNDIEKYNSFNFSPIWTKTDNSNIYGIIGNENERLRIKLTSIIKNKTNPNEYIVIGKSKVKDNICDFKGYIRIKKIHEFQELHFGVDEVYKNKGIKSQGLLIAEYEILENKEQKYSGIFKGKLYSLWYLDKNNKIQYDNIENISDSYSNNAFIGTWNMYNSKFEKKSNWSDYRVPNPTSDFDVGAGEFAPNEKYFKNGWENYTKAFVRGNKEAKIKEQSEWWK